MSEGDGLSAGSAHLARARVRAVSPFRRFVAASPGVGQRGGAVVM